MINFRLLILFFAIILLLLSCQNKDDIINSPIDFLTNNYDNTPVIVNTENSYTFTLKANKFSYSSDDELNFSTDSLVITLSLTNVNESNGSMKVFNNIGQEIFSETLSENKVIVQTDFIGQTPTRIIFELADFTGQLAAVVATKVP